MVLKSSKEMEKKEIMTSKNRNTRLPTNSTNDFSVLVKNLYNEILQ